MTQSPTSKTRVSKCLDLAAHSARMLSKFTANAVLVDLAAKMQAGAALLSTAQSTYEMAVRDILPTRVDVKYENYVSDKRIRVTQKKLEIVDGKRLGKIAAIVFPEGSTPITRLYGDSQIKAMEDLEGRLEATKDLWSEALDEKAAIAEKRADYKKALEGRNNAAQKARDLRILRNVAKEQFLNTYAEVMNLVKAEFPRDKEMQELFFDEVRTLSALATADGDTEEDGNETPGETKTE